MRLILAAFFFFPAANLFANIKTAISLFEKRDYKEAYRLFVKESFTEHPESYYYLALMNEKGLGLEVNERKAVEFYDRAAALGEPNSLYIIGLAHLNGYYGKEKDTKKGLAMLGKAEEKGNQDAAVRLGEIYYKGYASILPNFDMAISHFKRIEKVNPKARYYLGLMTMNGEGVRKNVKKGFNLIYSAALAGYDAAQIETGKIYMGGRGIEKNYQAALKWFKKAGQERIEEAAFYIALVYASKDFNGRDELKAYSWHIVASRYGNRKSQGILDLDRKKFSEKQLKKARTIAENNIKEIYK